VNSDVNELKLFLDDSDTAFLEKFFGDRERVRDEECEGSLAALHSAIVEKSFSIHMKLTLLSK